MIVKQAFFALVVLVLGLQQAANAHEVNPAYLELTQTGEEVFEVVWKQPLKDGRRLRLIPTFPESCENGPKSLERAPGAVIERWVLFCDLRAGEIEIDGLERTLTDVFVRISRLEGATITSVLRPTTSVLSLDEPVPGAPLLAYLWIGVEHIIFGYDHLLFVLGLCLLVRPSQLLMTVTAFTIAHSITLGLATLAGITMPGPPVEAVIALSIVLLGREALSVQAGRPSMTQSYPWLIAFGFGLIHGFGFAGALSEIGLPPDQEFWALLLFNLGVELGQIAFVIALLGAAFVLWRLVRRAEPITRTLAAYAIGVAGMFWLIERVSGF